MRYVWGVSARTVDAEEVVGSVVIRLITHAHILAYHTRHTRAHTQHRRAHSHTHTFFVAALKAGPGLPTPSLTTYHNNNNVAPEWPAIAAIACNGYQVQRDAGVGVAPGHVLAEPDPKQNMGGQ